MNEQISLAESSELFLLHLKIEKSASKLTIINYANDLKQLREYLSIENELDSGNIAIDLLQHQEIRKYLIYLQEKGLARSTIARKLASIRSLVKFLCRENFLEINPIANIITPKQEKKLPKFLYPKEIEILLEAPDTTCLLGKRDKAILELFYATGIRVSELVSMDLSNIEINERIIKVYGKGSKERLVPFGIEAKKSLLEYLEKARLSLILKNRVEKALFLNKSGNRITSRAIRNIINKYVADVAINQKISPHTIRHTFATHLLNQGADLRSVQELLGHVKLSTTQIYTHVSKEKVKSVFKELHPRR